MQFGAPIPARDFQDPVMIRDYVQALEGAGFDFVSSAEHVLGGHPDRVPEGERVHTYDVPYQDPFVLFGFIAGCTTRLGVVSSILILPQRQTALVAKQAADLDRLIGGRLRLGIGLGRNWMEYEALNENFRNRGRRVEEQVEVLRQLWTDELVTFEGEWHHLDRMGLNPMPVQRPIPIWFGTYVGQIVENAIRRVGRIGDGWFPQFAPDDQKLIDTLERIRGYAREAGRDPSEIGIDASLRGEDPDDMARQAELWKELGATHLRVGGPGGASGSLQERIDTLTSAREALQRAGF
jgi:probable F420-dependent oxidoreductase